MKISTGLTLQLALYKIMWLNCCRVILISFIVVRKITGGLITDEDQAREFLRCKDKTIIRRCEEGHKWQFLVNTRANDFAWQNFTDPLLKRAFMLTAKQEADALKLEEEKNYPLMERNFQIRISSQRTFLNSGACLYHKEENVNTDENCTWVPRSEVSEKFNKFNNADERKYYWNAWRDSVGKMKSHFDERLHINSDLNASFWLKEYKETSPSILEDVDRVYQEILPLYKELHAYIRRRLINTYRNERIRSNGPIPSHLLGLTTENWFAIKDVVLPYPGAKVDVTEIMKERNMKTIDLLKLAEEFYHSTGLPNIDDNVWNNSKIAANERCAPTLQFDTSCTSELSGITACTPIHEFNLHRIIGYTADIHSFKNGRPDWPKMIQFLPSRDFRPALQFLAELSTWTNEYMALKGFVEADPGNDTITSHEMNDLMMVALRFLPVLQHLYKGMKWRLDTYTCTVSDRNYNQKWWEYSLKYQGTCPPVRRTEENFDPASSVKIAMEHSFLREFIGIVYSFQFHKAICDKVGYNRFLHRCNLYGKKAFGDKFWQLVYYGNSITVPEALLLMTNGASNKMDTKPMLEYFKYLSIWLKIQNPNETFGWQSDDPMVCP